MTTTLPVPHDLAAERAIVSGILLDNAAIDEVADVLQPEDFYSRKLGLCYGAELALSQKSEPIDLLTLRAELAARGDLGNAGGDEELVTLTNEIPNLDALESYARRVRGLATVRAMVTAATRVAASGRAPIEDLDVWLDEAEATLHAVAISRRADRRCHPLKDLVIRAVEDIQERAKVGEVRGVPTGITRLDRLLSGLRPSNLIILAGRPGMGKTAFALHVIEHVAHAGPVLGWSGEMGGEEWAERLLVAGSGIDGDKMRMGGHGKGESFSQNEWASFNKAAVALAGLPVEIDDTPAISLWQLRSKARRMKARGGLALVVADYLQLMRSGERYSAREQEVAAISRGLKALAKELEVPVMALSQLNRDLEKRADKRPNMSDLRESGQLEQDADVVLFLYRDEYYDPDTTEENVAEIIVAKQRGGRVDTVKAFFNPAKMRWGNLDSGAAAFGGNAAPTPPSDDFADDHAGEEGWR